VSCPREARHHEVEQHHVGGGAGAQVAHRDIAVLGVADREALALEDRLDQPALSRIVIDHEDRFGHLKTPTDWTLVSLNEALFLSPSDTGQG
jgi:hypothetical protein